MEFDLEAALKRLKHDFFESTIEKLDKIDIIIDNIYNERGNRGEQFFELQRDVHSIKGSAGTNGLHLLTTIAHRLEDFLEAARLSKEQWRFVQQFIDVMRELVDLGEEPVEKERQAILAKLPSSQHTTAKGFSKQKNRKVTILVIMPAGVQRKVIAKELADCGFDLSFSDQPIEALRLIMEIQPDAILSNLDFQQMTGVELARVLKVIHKTADIPFAIMTSENVCKGIDPCDLSVIKKDLNFISNLTDYLMETGLFGRL